jgi:hypothetical protein
MPNDRPSPFFFSLISSSLCAAVVLNCAVYRRRCGRSEGGNEQFVANRQPPTAGKR